MKWDCVDYRELRPSTLHEERFRHVKLLLFWPVFGMLFALVERGLPGRVYHPVYCPMDDMIPFCEWFLIPYLFWFVFLVGMLVYGFFFDRDSFCGMMRYVMITYTVTMLVYLLYPTVQYLRPVSFARDNLLTRFVAWFYTFDTNTNVCPSIHVLGAFAAMYAGWNSRHFSSLPWRAAFAVATALICLSTVFLKQHSVMDVLLALPLALAAYPLAFGKKEERRSARALHARRRAAEPL